MAPKLDRNVHYPRTTRMLVETFSLLTAFCVAGVLLSRHGQGQWWGPVALVALTIAQGGWLHRLYTAGHEAVHRKMIPDSKRWNDVIGQLLLLPLLIPLPIYRKIHKFHHTHNRRDHRTSTLEGYVVGSPPGILKRAVIKLAWYIGVFAGGYFIHGVISIMLFLFVPPQLAPKISPAFKGWSIRDQVSSVVLFLACVGFHAGFAQLFGVQAWVCALGLPLLFFAWIYSLFVYIYHYKTSYGDSVVYNVRSVDAPAFFKWWLLNFNHHRVHHRYPALPWHQLPDEPAELPEEFASNENVENLLQAVGQQLTGPQIFVEPAAPQTHGGA